MKTKIVLEAATKYHCFNSLKKKKKDLSTGQLLKPVD